MKTRFSLWVGLALLGLQMAAMAEERVLGFRIDRLSAGQLKVWRSIARIATARDESGRSLHPKLHELWQRVASGKHEVKIEILTPMYLTSYAAGRFEIESCDPGSNQCTAVIRLCLPVIEKAIPAIHDRLTDEFIPFAGLGIEERYAEVLGHELKHAVCALEDPHYASVMNELDRQGRELTRLLRQKGGLSKQEKQQRIERLRSLANEIEKPAETAEAEIWGELRQGQGMRKDTVR